MYTIPTSNLQLVDTLPTQHLPPPLLVLLSSSSVTTLLIGNPQHLHLNTITTDAAEIQICDNIAYGNLQANNNPEYVRLDQPVYTYETLNQDEDKPERNVLL